MDRFVICIKKYTGCDFNIEPDLKIIGNLRIKISDRWLRTNDRFVQ